jgi:hypothetical protein
MLRNRGPAWTGIRTCTHKLGGVTRKSTWNERLFLKRIIVALQSIGVSVHSSTQTYKEVMSAWASAVVEKGPVWRVFFEMRTPEEHARVFALPLPETPGAYTFDD